MRILIVEDEARIRAMLAEKAVEARRQLMESL